MEPIRSDDHKSMYDPGNDVMAVMLLKRRILVASTYFADFGFVYPSHHTLKIVATPPGGSSTKCANKTRGNMLALSPEMYTPYSLEAEAGLNEMARTSRVLPNLQVGNKIQARNFTVAFKTSKSHDFKSDFIFLAQVSQA